jgi:hypothetical protein
MQFAQKLCLICSGLPPLLIKLNTKTPGVYFYVLPDGNYYSIEQDFTNLNLSDRGYFQSLMAGKLIKGFPVLSRSTGKKSAVMAAPIIVNNKVTGALGVSIYLDELHSRLNEKFALPANYTWFVLDATGNTMLDKETDYIFMNALTQGTESLTKAITTMLKNKSGKMEYEIGGLVRRAQYQKLASLDWWMVIAEVQKGTVKPAPKSEITLKRFVPELQGKLDRIDAYMLKFMKDSNWDNEAAIRKGLSSIFRELPEVVNAGYVDVKGVLRYIEPADYRNFEGADIRAQEHVTALLKKPMPVFSAGFISVEGFPAFDIAYPAYDIKGKFIGSISLLINPTQLVKPILKEVSFAEGYEPWIMQLDGMIVYDPDTEEVGKMLFTDPIYKGYESLLELGKRISSERTGAGEYIYQAMGHQEKVIKTCIWDTVSLYGREWRVVLAHREK